MRTSQRSIASNRLITSGIAVTGSPPFGPFLSEFTILRAAIDSGQLVVAGLFLGMLFIVFVGMGATVLSVVQGEPSKTAAENGFHDSALTVGPIIAFLALVLLLGVYIPPVLATSLILIALRGLYAHRASAS